jgi:hypothetical protein
MEKIIEYLNTIIRSNGKIDIEINNRVQKSKLIQKLKKSSKEEGNEQ